jgi:hypothetical protein
MVQPMQNQQRNFGLSQQQLDDAQTLVTYANDNHISERLFS